MFTRSYWPGDYFAPRYWPDVAAIPPVPGPSVVTSGFAGGGFLGPYYERKRKKRCDDDEVFCPTPDVHIFGGKAELRRALAAVIRLANKKLPQPRAKAERPGISLYNSRFTPELRKLMASPEYAAQQAKRRKRRREDEEMLFILMQ